MSPIPLTGSGNPLLDEIDRAHEALSPPAKHALIQGVTGAGVDPMVGLTGGTAPGPIPIAPPAQSPAPGMIPAGAAAIPHGSAPGAIPIRSQPTPMQGELSRLETSGSGVNQIKSPWARIPAQIGDALLGGFLPAISSAIPGTTLHHKSLVNQAQGAVTNEDTLANTEAKRGLEQAQTVEAASLPDLHKSQLDLANTKAADATELGHSKLDLQKTEGDLKHEVDQAKVESSLRQHGFRRDEKTGGIVPLAREEMSEDQQAVHDLKESQSELANARKDFEEAKTKNAPVLMELAKRRIDNANHTASIAERRLGLSLNQFELKSQGTVNGVAPEGAMISDSGSPVGTAFQQNVRPTGQERNKADLANSAHEQLQDIKSIVAKRPDIFGPVSGRKTDFTVWLGSQDPDAQRFRAARTIAGDHLAGVFGGRSEAALQSLDAAIGHFKDNPAAMQAGLDQLDKANKSFQSAGSVKTVGSNAAATHASSATGGSTPTVTTKEEYDKLAPGTVYMEDGRKYKKP